MNTVSAPPAINTAAIDTSLQYMEPAKAGPLGRKNCRPISMMTVLCAGDLPQIVRTECPTAGQTLRINEHSTGKTAFVQHLKGFHRVSKGEISGSVFARLAESVPPLHSPMPPLYLASKAYEHGASGNIETIYPGLRSFTDPFNANMESSVD